MADVRLRKRLGQNNGGSTVRVSDSEAEWLTQRGYADAVPTTTHTTVDSEGEGSGDDVPTTPRTTTTPKRKR